MVKPANCKVWNEDLVLACQSRYEMAVRNEQQQQYLWREGAEKIQAVRGDIYTFSTGRVVNLPQNLKKTVHNLCMDVIQGRKNVLPDGYAAARQQDVPPGNPFERHPYLNKIKARGGAYAILMAFHHSQTSTLTKDQICNAAQPFCDEDMRENYFAGRSYGAWASNKTLLNHGLLTKGGGTNRYIEGVGFRRNGPDSYTLTRDGEKFIEVMLRKFPPTAAAHASAHFGTPAHATRHFPTSNGSARPASAKRSANKLEDGDEEKLRDWVLSAGVNETIAFSVGKARRKCLHDLCDRLEREVPGLRLHHSSSHETATRRVLTVQVEQMPAKRPLFNGSPVDHGSLDSVLSLPGAKRLRSDVPPKVAAAQAAMERQALHESLVESKRKPFTVDIDTYEDMERRAIEESIKTAQKPDSLPDSMGNGNADGRKLAAVKNASYEEMERRAIEESLKTARMYVASPDSDEEMNAAIQTSALSANKDSSQETPFSDWKLPARDTSATKQKVTAKRELFPSNVEPVELSSDDDDEIPPRVFSTGRDKSIVLVPNGGRTATISLLTKDDESTKQRAPPTGNHGKAPLVINLDDDDDNSLNDEVIEINESQDNSVSFDENVQSESQQNVIVLDDSQDYMVPSTPPVVAHVTFPQLHVLIDSRERNRNATPSHLRMELTSLITAGALRSVWPHNMLVGNVAEMQLTLGDFAFDIETQGTERKRIPIAVERKRVSDLVQRSVKGDHWRQFLKMRDECRHAIFLIENDTRTAASFTAYGSQELDHWTPNGTLIDDEKSIFLFIGRCLLSSPISRFIQTRDEISSLRAVGALGMMAACSKELVHSAAKTAPPSCNSERALVDQLTLGGIPWKLAQQMGRSFGSICHLEFLYKNCSSDECRSALLVPFVAESDYNGMYSDSVGWSEAIYRAFHAADAKASIVRRSLSDHKHEFEDHGRFISALYSNNSPEAAYDSINAVSASTTRKTYRRHVSIELAQDESQLFPAPTESSFYSLKKSEKNPMDLVLSTIVMRTRSGRLSSHYLFVHLLQAKSMVALITTRIQHSRGDYVSVAKDVANSINCDCYNRSMKRGKDRRVLLLCGLTPALDAVAKKADYRPETRVLVDMVLAQLMLAHDLVVIQALRLSGDTELILQQLALACFHYHLLSQDGDF
jgi:hypothetical protein